MGLWGSVASTSPASPSRLPHSPGPFRGEELKIPQKPDIDFKPGVLGWDTDSVVPHCVVLDIFLRHYVFGRVLGFQPN